MEINIGDTFDRLTVVEDLGRFCKEGTESVRHYYKCICSCVDKTERIVDKYKLLSGHTTSCGCKAKEFNSKRLKEDNPNKYYIRPINEHYVDQNNICHIKMSNTQNEMLCDQDDMEKLLQYYWNENRDGYARSLYQNKRILAHRIVMNAGDYNGNNLVDHINGNTLDNRKGNLRMATQSQNHMNSILKSDNTSGYRGVQFDKNKGKWYAVIQKDYKRYFCGYYNTREEAAEAYSKKADELFGEFKRAA